MTSTAGWLTILGALTWIAVGARGDLGAQDLSPEYLLVVGGNGGAAFSRSCPADAVLTGIRSRLGLTMDAIGIKCRTVQADGTLGTENHVGSLAGGTGGLASQSSCPRGTVIAGQLGSTYLAVLGYLRLSCYRWDANTRRFGSFVGDIHVWTPNGIPVPSPIGGSKCTHTTQPARGIRGRAGTLVDAVGLVCNEP